MAGFEYSHRLSGGAPTIRALKPKAGITALHAGDLVNIESGLADLAATNDTKIAGVVIGPGMKAGDTGVTDLTAIGANDRVEVVVDQDAVYKVTDANARLFGATLDVAGATGAQAVAASTNADLVVASESTALQPTLVMISQANHVTAGV